MSDWAFRKPRQSIMSPTVGAGGSGRRHLGEWGSRRIVRPRKAGDVVPGPHRVQQVVADIGVGSGRGGTTEEERVRLRAVEPVVEPLPTSPQPVDVAVEEEEQGIAGCCATRPDIT